MAEPAPDGPAPLPGLAELVRRIGEPLPGGGWEYRYSCTNAACSELIYGVRIRRGHVIDGRCPVCLEPGLPGVGPEGTGLKLRTLRMPGVDVAELEARDGSIELEAGDVDAALEQDRRRRGR